MVTFFSLYTSSCSLLLVLISLTTTPLFLPTNGAPVDDVCRQTKDPALCLRDLSLSEPRIRSETLQSLAGVIIRKAKLEGSQIKRMFHDFISSPGDRYSQCDQLYDDVVATLYAADEAVKGRRYDELKGRAGHVRGNVDRCEALFNNKSPLHPWTPDIWIYADALGVIANTLSK